MENKDFIMNHLIDDLETNKQAKRELKETIKETRRNKIKNFKLHSIVYNPSIAEELSDFNIKQAKSKIKEGKKLIKSINKDNKIIRKSIHELRKDL